MKRITKSVLAYLTLGMILITWALAEFLSWYQMQEISSALVMMAAIVGMQQWFAPALRSLRDGREGSDFLSFAIFVNIFTLAAQRVWINLLRWLERPDWLVYSPISSTTALMIAYSICIIILARETRGGIIPRRNIFLVLTALFMAGIFYVITLTFLNASSTDIYGQPLNRITIPGIGAITCPDDKPIRVEAYCRATPGTVLKGTVSP